VRECESGAATRQTVRLLLLVTMTIDNNDYDDGDGVVEQKEGEKERA
jgi:hypothetical protein